MSMRKEWRVDIAPLLFFALVVGVKTYYLIGYIQAAEPLLDALGDAGQREAAGSGLAYAATGQFSHISPLASSDQDITANKSLTVACKRKVSPLITSPSTDNSSSGF